MTWGWARGMSAPDEDLSAEILTAMDAVLSGTTWLQPLFATLLAAVQLRAGKAPDALAVIDRTEAALGSEANQFLSLLLTAKGDVLLATDPTRTEPIEAAYRSAIDVARDQTALLWELRAATRLARVWREAGHVARAGELLSPLIAGMSEESDFAEVREARDILDQLA